MANYRTFLIISLLGLMAGCSYGYRATGAISDLSAPLAGKAELRNSGGGRFNLSSAGNELLCEGLAEPPDPASSRAGCLEERGSGHMRCSDGRAFALNWKALSCRAFEGDGRDQNGNTLVFSVRREYR